MSWKTTSPMVKLITVMSVGGIIMSFALAPSDEEIEARAQQEAAIKQAEIDKFNALSEPEQMIVRAGELGANTRCGGGASKQLIRNELRDPDSFKLEGEYLAMSKNLKTAKINVVYYARNGFGGMNKGVYTCEFKWNPETKTYENVKG